MGSDGCPGFVGAFPKAIRDAQPARLRNPEGSRTTGSTAESFSAPSFDVAVGPHGIPSAEKKVATLRRIASHRAPEPPPPVAVKIHPSQQRTPSFLLQIFAVNTPADPFEPVLPPKAVVARISLYLRQLEREIAAGTETISSTRLGGLLGLTDSQVRKDLGWFGHLGYRGVGYRCVELAERIRSNLGTSRNWPVALVGCGHLGQALLGYGGFSRQGFQVRAAFDTDPGIIGQSLRGIRIEDFGDFRDSVRRENIELVILAVPVNQAESTAAEIARSGILGILNFAPTLLNLPGGIAVSNVDLTIELEQLAFAVVQARKKR